MTFWLCPVPTLGLVQRQMLEMVTLSLSLHSSIGAAKPILWESFTGCQCPSSAFPGDLQHIQHLRNHSGRSTLGKAKQWFYANKEVVSTWECSNAFLTKFFPLGKTDALRNKISSFQQLMNETIAEAWE
jgi:hypothetical protein